MVSANKIDMTKWENTKVIWVSKHLDGFPAYFNCIHFVFTCLKLIKPSLTEKSPSFEGFRQLTISRGQNLFQTKVE